METPLSDIFAYILFSASSPSFPSGKPWLQEKSHSLAYLKRAAYFHHHTSAFTAQRQRKSPKFISGDLWHTTTLFCLYPYIHAQISLREQTLSGTANSKHMLFISIQPPDDCLLIWNWNKVSLEPASGWPQSGKGQNFSCHMDQQNLLTSKPEIVYW